MHVEWHAIDGPLPQSSYGDDATDPCEDDLCVANAGLAVYMQKLINCFYPHVLQNLKLLIEFQVFLVFLQAL